MDTIVKISDAKASIYQAGAELFKEKGYVATSVRELASRVGLEASSLYNHIKSKEEILIHICMGNAQKFTDGIKEIESIHPKAIHRLEGIIQLHVDIAAGSVSSVSVFNDEWKHLSEPYQSEFLKMRKQYEQKVLQFVKQGIEEGSLKEVDPKIALYSFLTSLRWIHYWFKPGRIAKERLYENLCIILLSGIKK